MTPMEVKCSDNNFFNLLNYIQHLFRGFYGGYGLITIKPTGFKFFAIVQPGNDGFTERIRLAAGRNADGVICQ